METYRVPSSLLEQVRYDPAQMMMELSFRSGEMYRYAGVPRDVVEGLVHPEDGSTGRYFEAHVRGAFPQQFVEDASA